MATELGPTPVKKPASGGTELHHAPKGVGEDNVIASQGKWASWLLAPTIVALSIVIVYPIISAIVMSFQADAGLDPATGLFTEGGPAGFSNYVNWLAQQCTAPDGGTVSCPPGTLGSQFWSAPPCWCRGPSPPQSLPSSGCSSSPLRASPTSSSAPRSCGRAANGRPSGRSSLPTSGKRRRSWRS